VLDTGAHTPNTAEKQDKMQRRCTTRKINIYKLGENAVNTVSIKRRFNSGVLLTS
jgi:hypothetical protein